MSRQHHAREDLSFQQALALLEEVDAHTGKILARVNRVAPLPGGAAVLDIGAAQGLFVLCCARRGHDVAGVEPSDLARATAERIARDASVSLSIVAGVAENLPFPDARFDFVHANSVVEHVADPKVVFGEVHRVLRPGGLFWFATASSLCPRQNEIAAFPLFGWYPDRIKRRIMRWAKRCRPGLIGHTDSPAMHWFTPGKARRMLAGAGFARVYDRWQFRLASEGGRCYRAALSVIRACRPARFLADVLVEGCNFAAVK